uniref:Uncharacterized protein n=1 Tax=Cannabis sativa TaxID=3483 RepID=A0A803QVJ7_CANSA
MTSFQNANIFFVMFTHACRFNQFINLDIYVNGKSVFSACFCYSAEVQNGLNTFSHSLTPTH